MKDTLKKKLKVYTLKINIRLVSCLGSEITGEALGKQVNFLHNTKHI